MLGSNHEVGVHPSSISVGIGLFGAIHPVWVVGLVRLVNLRQRRTGGDLPLVVILSGELIHGVAQDRNRGRE
jgi:hypothetical protein